MSEPHQTVVVYATSSEYKREEISVLESRGTLLNGEPLGARVRFEMRGVDVKETLEVDLEEMVRAEATAAYRELLVPCIVEHAGLVFTDYIAEGYPGGLTKPMWNTLGRNFAEETHSAGRRAIARAVVGYCDGQEVRTFVGETAGSLAHTPRGSRAFYWDTVFVPDKPNGDPGTLTYAEIVADGSLGLAHKVLELSQSTRAMLNFLAYRLAHAPRLWPPS